MSSSLRYHSYGSNFGSLFAEIIVSNCALVILITPCFRRSFVLMTKCGGSSPNPYVQSYVIVFTMY